MASNTPFAAAIICAENIALLHQLHPVPSVPSRNPIDAEIMLHHNGYTLSFEQERKLTSILAFLSSIKDDPEHIPAVCIRENRQKPSLNLLIAVNKSKHGDGNHALERIKLGFEHIFATLAVNSDKDRVFAAVVSMCSERIRCRLRLISNSKGKEKQPLKAVLQDAISGVQLLGAKKVTKLKTAAHLFVERAKEVIKRIDSWTKYQTQARLEDVIEGLYHLRKVEQLQDLLDIIPNRDMGPSARKNLLNIVSKVARYREAARWLYRTAKRLAVVRNMEVVIVKLPQEAFQRVAITDYNIPTLASTMPRYHVALSHSNMQRNVASHFYRHLDTTEGKANEKFAQQTLKGLTQAKIHAEIQILFYCELNPSGLLPPRVVGSSKDACFLCNAFISIYKKVHTPRCHGRLYPGWRLPSLRAFESMQREFNNVLEQKVGDSLLKLLSSKKVLIPCPNESTLSTLPSSASTLTTTLESRPIETVTSRNIPTQSSSDPTAEPHEASLTCTTLRNTSKLTPSIAINTVVREEDGQSDASSIHSFHQSASLINSSSPQVVADYDDSLLVQGQMLSAKIEFDNKSRRYKAGLLEVQIERSAGSHLSAYNGNSPKEVLCSVEWLTTDQLEQMQEHGTVPITDVELLESGMEQDVQTPNCFYLAAQGSVVRIRIFSNHVET